MSHQRTFRKLTTTGLVLASIVSIGATPAVECFGVQLFSDDCEMSRACCCRPTADRQRCCCQPEADPPLPASATADEPVRTVIWLLLSQAAAKIVAVPAATNDPTAGSPGGAPSSTRPVRSLYCVWQI